MNNAVEQEILSREDTKKLADDCCGEPDPFSKIQPSLLSAEHIEAYVKATGLIGPYFTGGGKKARLKKAAYEGRIGTCAYRYNEKDELVSIPLRHSLVVPANSIVFVECDLDFRLPEFIALRFNLQIRHVHRGLLLGTGPLVDPGYWGKLCIPLHNLTDEDYKIPLYEGLIWLEFTKTTSDLAGATPIGRPPLDKEFWDIKDFIEKAASSFKEGVAPVAIRSSIPSMVAKANKLSAEAVVKSRNASESAKGAKSAARRVQLISIVAALGAIIGVVGLWSTFFFGSDGQYNTVSTRVDQIQRDVADNAMTIDGVVQRNDSTNLDVSTVVDEIRETDSRISSLEEEIEKLATRIVELKGILKSQGSDTTESE